ncbi:MAG TPA: Ig-like domain-containing protein [Planctomycetota bacterium]|nr:Ig-like domain-containing protein [Planctomycetota bacterium]
MDPKAVDPKAGGNPKAWRMGILAACVATACSGGGGTGTSTNPAGTYSSTPSGARFFTDANEQGNSNQLVLESIFWGRLTDVYGLDGAGDRVLMHENLVIGKGVQSDGINYQLKTNPVTAVQELTILRNVEDLSVQGGLDQFEDLVRRTQQSLDPVAQRGPGTSQGGSAGLFSMVPRNACLVLDFNDLIDPNSIDAQTVRLLTGIDFSGTYEARILPDPNFGDLADHDGLPGLEFYSTRILIDPTISVIESYDFDPPVPVNSNGFPPSSTVNLANLLIRIPTREDSVYGQTHLLQNLSAHHLSTSANGSWDASRPTQDVHRAMRSGGGTLVTGDAYNGFLLDNEAPTVVGASAGDILTPPTLLTGTTDQFLIPVFQFESTFCAKVPEAGDVVAQVAEGIFADVLGAQSLNGADASNVRVRLRQYPAEWDLPGRGGPAEWSIAGSGYAELQTAFDPVADIARVPCFLRINPLPTGYPNNPNFGVLPDSTFEIRFSEPMDPASISAFDSLLLTRQALNPGNDPSLPTSAFVVGQVSLAPDLQRVSFTPQKDLTHEQGSTEEYFLSLLGGELGATDLAGNEVGGNFPPIPFQLNSASASVLTGGRVSRFTGLDEEPEDPFSTTQQDYGVMREWGGQHLFDLQRQLIFPRPVTRFTTTADRTQTVPALMVPFSVGIQTPLSNLGLKMQSVYRFVDLGWTLEDASTANVDVTGLSWAPVNGLVTFDSYSEFEMRMSHCRYAPDEFIDGATLWPMWPDSGLSNVYTSNLLNGTLDPQRVVHEKSQGYVVDPGLVFTVSGSLTKFMPYPMNNGLANPNDEITYTWRDTSLLTRSGPNNGGSPPDQQALALGQDPGVDIFPTNQIKTIGLPLLVEFRCYPDAGATGLNGFDINLAANSSSKPYFRAFSTGGIDSGNNVRTVNPDTATTSTGGFSPAANGQATYGRDNSFYLAAIDFVTRVSRSYSVWFPADDPSNPGAQFLSPTYAAPVLEPRAQDQPNGTSISLDFRGASNITNHPDATGNLMNGTTPIRQMALVDASTLDIYGDYYSPPVPPANPLPHRTNRANLNIFSLAGSSSIGDGAWVSNITEINGARFYQIRITFRSNIVSNENPVLSALAVSWEE